MIAKILLGLAILIVLLLLVAALQPGTFRTERSAFIPASAERVSAEIEDLTRYAQWNPWGKLDPAMKTSFGGPARGVGATMSWSGNASVGSGRMTIVEVQPAQLVRMRLEFDKPFPSTNTVDFTLDRIEDGTRVTWSMYGERTLLPKAVGLFINMDKMLGGFFEQGLANLATRLSPPQAGASS